MLRTSPSSTEVAFLIFGTPRSGTTLVQRLVCELPGVRVPPETHFFKRYAPAVLGRRRFPLDALALREEIEIFGKLDTSQGLDVDPEAILEDLGGACGRLIDLFSAIVRHLAGHATVYGEKTPEHLFWWRPLSRALPTLKFIAVVRDPRGVVASNLQVGWNGRSYVELAERWLSDQRQVRKAIKALGRSRLMIVRYEDVVTDPDGARRKLAGFLAIPSEGQVSSVHGSQIFLPREHAYKGQAVDRISSDRIEAWREALSKREAQDIAAICRPEMKTFGYSRPVSSVPAAWLRIAHLPLRVQMWRIRFRFSRTRSWLRTNRAVV